MEDIMDEFDAMLKNALRQIDQLSLPDLQALNEQLVQYGQETSPGVAGPAVSNILTAASNKKADIIAESGLNKLKYNEDVRRFDVNTDANAAIQAENTRINNEKLKRQDEEIALAKEEMRLANEEAKRKRKAWWQPILGTAIGTVLGGEVSGTTNFLSNLFKSKSAKSSGIPLYEDSSIGT